MSAFWDFTLALAGVTWLAGLLGWATKDEDDVPWLVAIVELVTVVGWLLWLPAAIVLFYRWLGVD